ncbi:MAG: hypothetical protein V1717_00355 [Candidatus Micrarchaeota archaeon]
MPRLELHSFPVRQVAKVEHPKERGVQYLWHVDRREIFGVYSSHTHERGESETVLHITIRPLPEAKRLALSKFFNSRVGKEIKPVYFDVREKEK